MKGDGNCFFRSLSACLSDTESDHSRLRCDVVQYMKVHCTHLFATSIDVEDEGARRHFDNMGKDGVWVGDDVVKAAAHFLGRAIHVYAAVGNLSPLIYEPDSVASCTSQQQLQLAYYEPGHYRAVKCFASASRVTEDPSEATKGRLN